MIFIEIWELIGPELSIRPDSPPVDFVGIGENDTSFFRDYKLLDFISFGYTRKINFLEDEYIFFRLDSLFEAFLFYLIIIIELLIFRFLLTLIVIDVFGFLVIRVVVV